MCAVNYLPLQVMLPPGARGTISYIAPAGEYTVQDEVIEIEFQVRGGWGSAFILKQSSHKPYLLGIVTAPRMGLTLAHQLAIACPAANF
jgi:hypothetical protein